jgi:hypothetical protein
METWRDVTLAWRDVTNFDTPLQATSVTLQILTRRYRPWAWRYLGVSVTSPRRERDVTVTVTFTMTVTVTFIVILSYYSNNYDFVPFALPSRYRPVTVTTLPWSTVGHRYIPLLTVTDRFPSLPNVTCVTCVTYFILQKPLNELF